MTTKKQTSATAPQTTFVGPQTLAALLGISEIRVHNLIGRVFKQEPGGKFELGAAIFAYIQHIRKSKNIPEEGSAQEREAEEKAIRARIARELDEIKLQKARQDVHLTEDVRRVWNDIIGSFKVKLLTMPQMLSAKLADRYGIDKNDVESMLHSEVRDICSLLTAYSADTFYQRNPGGIDDTDDTSASDATVLASQNA